MRYFTYISDAKVDMLLPQVPKGLKQKIAAEIGFDLAVVSGKIGAEIQTLDTRVARLKVVEAHIRQTEPLGSPSAPQAWIDGQAEMGGADLDSSALLFVGEAQGWILALAGSSKHLAGGAAPDAVSVPFSFLPTIASHLQAIADDPNRPLGLHQAIDADDPALEPGRSADVDSLFFVTQWCLDHATAPFQDVGFLAKRLVTKHYKGRTATLASPLYIELLD